MPCLEASPLLSHSLAFTLFRLARSLGPLLAEADRLDLAAFLGNDDVGLLGVVRGSLGLVVTRHASPSESGILFADRKLLAGLSHFLK